MRRGRGSYPGDMPGCYIQAINGIEIGDYCLFGPNCGLISANHDVAAGPGPERHLPADPIRIGDRCWIGFGAVVLKDHARAIGMPVSGGRTTVDVAEAEFAAAGVVLG